MFSESAINSFPLTTSVSPLDLDSVSPLDLKASRVQPNSMSAASAPPDVPHPPDVPPSSVARGGKTIADFVVDRATYSASDVGVVPPATVYPQLLTVLAPGSYDGRATIEIVVNERGTVESVKAKNAPPMHSLGEYLLMTMSLSATKSWRFLPALKDGRPVKYRTFVLLDTY